MPSKPKVAKPAKAPFRASGSTVVDVVEAPRAPVSPRERAKTRTATTVVDVPEPAPRPKSRTAATTTEIDPKKPRPRSVTPQSRSKAITLPRPQKPRWSSRLPLYLLTEPDGLLAGQPVKAGLFDNPKPGEIRAYEPNDLGYSMLATRNSRYLHVDRIWPVMINQASALVRDDRKRGWKFKLVQLGEPLLLNAPETWELLIDSGLARTPKTKRDPSLLIWPAIKGHTKVLRTLLDRGVPIPQDDVVMALLRELKVP